MTIKKNQIEAYNKSDVGLGNIDNTSDADKPVSTAQQAALDGKVNNTGNETISGDKTFSGSTNTTGGLNKSGVNVSSDSETSTYTNKTIDGNNNTLTVLGSQVSGNISGTSSNVTGTVSISNGGTGQNAKTAAFDSLSPTTTKGDIIVNNTNDNIRLAVGTDDQVLTADSTAPEGVAWKDVGGGGGWELLGSAELSVSSGNLNVSSLAAKNELHVLIYVPGTSANGIVVMRLNGNSSGYNNSVTSRASNSLFINDIYARLEGNNTDDPRYISAFIKNKSGDSKIITGTSSAIELSEASAPFDSKFASGWFNSAVVSSILVETTSPNLDAGTKILVYGRD